MMKLLKIIRRIEMRCYNNPSISIVATADEWYRSLLPASARLQRVPATVSNQHRAASGENVGSK